MNKIPLYNLLELSQNLSNQEINKISDKILDNKLIIKYKYIPETLNNIPEILTYNENFNWQIRFEDKSNMAMLHLHSLDPIKYLLLSYQQSKDMNLINKSLELLFSWNKHAVTNSDFYTWYTHCVTDRTLIIGILLLEAQNSDFENKVIIELERMLKIHQGYLVKNENYRELNHGTMIDRSLIFSSLILNDSKTLEFSINRLKENFNITFTENMVCVENSVTYSIFNIELFISVEKEILNTIEESISTNFDLLINKSLDFINKIKMPNDTFPHFGDGEKVSLKTLKSSIIYTHYSDHKLFEDYKLTDKIQSYIYHNEGFIILKNQNKYLLCNSGSLRINHKHADDGSITYYNDEEIFVDSGIYSYDKNSLRSYFKSNVAHNSLVLNNESYDYAKSNIYDGYIDNYIEDTDYFYFQLINKHYKYANIARHIFILKDNFQILIHDQVISPVNNLNTQIFNLGPTIKVNFDINKPKKITLNERIIMKTDSNVDVAFHNAENRMGKYAEKFHSLINIPKLELSKSGAHQNITTLIQNTSVNTFDINTSFLEFNKLVLENKTEQFIVNLLPVHEPISLNNYLFINNINNKYFWKIYSLNYTNEEYAFYIYKNDLRFDIIWYSDNKTIEYDFNEPGIYTIRCFIRNKNNHDEKVAFRSKRVIIIND